MNLVFLLILVPFLYLLGRITIGRRLKSLAEKRSRITSFHKNLVLFVNSSTQDRQAYQSMVHQSALVQDDLGVYGVLKHYKAPFADEVYSNYPAFLNMLPELDRWLREDAKLFGVQPGRQIAQLLEDMLVRYLGILDDQNNQIITTKSQVLQVIREGLAVLVAFPLSLLSFIGFSYFSNVDSVAQNPIVKFVSGLLFLIGLVASIVGLVVDWPHFIKLFK